ncbi:AAA domain-containing protein [Actinomycetes bacterium KLBMP 9797]
MLISPTTELSEFHAAADRYLPGLPRHMYDGLDPTSSLYDLLSARFPSVVRLSEHFRSMPEIIGWSSAQFYHERLIPLRQFGADRLDPLKVVHIPDAIEQGRGTSMKNRAEADAIIDQVQKMIEDPAYQDRSIGVIALQGSGQVNLLERTLYERIDPADIKRFDIRVGQPPDFQGDQRHVILLSMVTVKAPRALGSGRKEKQRFNVAASRARDQMWLFTSVTAAGLNPSDLRHSLLTYMTNPPPTLTMDPALDGVSRDQLQQPFESLLEQQVFLDLRQRGYAVIPQYQVDARRIDLVVVGDQGRLAIECETPALPVTAEQLEHDLQRERELRRADWEFFRIRDSEYLFDSRATLEPLWRRLHERGIEPRSLAPPPRTQTHWTPILLPDDNPDDDGDS